MALQRYHRDPDDDSHPPDDAAYVLDAYRGQHNIDPTRMKMAIDQQANMIEWAQQNVVDPLVLARGFQVLEVASNYTDESIRNAALTIIHQANESTNDMVISMARALREGFDTSTQNLYNELVALSSFVEYQLHETKGSMQAIAKSAAQTAAIDAKTAAMTYAAEAEQRTLEQAAESTSAMSRQIEAIRKTLQTNIEKNRAANRDLADTMIVTAEAIQDIEIKVKRSEATIVEVQQQIKRLPDSAGITAIKADLEGLRDSITPMIEHIKTHQQLLRELESHREAVRTTTDEIKKLRQASDELGDHLNRATERYATKTDVTAAIEKINQALRSQRASQPNQMPPGFEELQSAMRSEVTKLSRQIQGAIEIIQRLHFPSSDMSDLTTDERLHSLKTLASQTQLPRSDAPKAARPAMASVEMVTRKPLTNFASLAHSKSDDSPPPRVDTFDPTTFDTHTDLRQEQDFLDKLRRESRSRRSSTISDADSEDSAATDQADNSSIQKSLGLTAKCELRVVHTQVHLTILTFGKLDKNEYVARWRDRLRKFIKGAKDSSDVDNILLQLGSSHDLMKISVKARNPPSIYAACTAHMNLLADIIRFELRAAGAAGFIIDSVTKYVSKAAAQKRKRYFDYEEVIDKISRSTQPRLGHQQQAPARDFGRGRGRGRGRYFNPYYPQFATTNPYNPGLQQPQQQGQPQQQFPMQAQYQGRSFRRW